MLKGILVVVLSLPLTRPRERSNGLACVLEGVWARGARLESLMILIVRMRGEFVKGEMHAWTCINGSVELGISIVYWGLCFETCLHSVL